MKEIKESNTKIYMKRTKRLQEIPTPVIYKSMLVLVVFVQEKCFPLIFTVFSKLFIVLKIKINVLYSFLIILMNYVNYFNN